MWGFKLIPFDLITGGISCVSEQQQYFNQEFAIRSVVYKLLVSLSIEANQQLQGHTVAAGLSLRAITVQRDCSYLPMFLWRFGAKERQLILCVLILFM